MLEGLRARILAGANFLTRANHPMSTNVETFGGRLALAMAVKGMRPLDLAEKLGIAPSTVYRWLQARDFPHVPADMLLTISDLLETSGRYLVRGIDDRAMRMRISPDESAIIERFRALSAAKRKRVLNHILDLTLP